MDKIRGIRSLPVRDRVCVVCQLNPLGIVPKVVRVITVGQQLAIVAEETVDPLGIGIPRATYESKSPLAEGSCRVPGFLQVMENSPRIGRKRELALGRQLDIASYRRVAAMRTGDKAGP